MQYFKVALRVDFFLALCPLTIFDLTFDIHFGASLISNSLLDVDFGHDSDFLLVCAMDLIFDLLQRFILQVFVSLSKFFEHFCGFLSTVMSLLATFVLSQDRRFNVQVFRQDYERASCCNTVVIFTLEILAITLPMQALLIELGHVLAIALNQ